MLIPISEVAADLGCEVGIIGGSGFYELLDSATEVALTTPYGDPAAPFSVGELAGRRVAFLPATRTRSHLCPSSRAVSGQRVGDGIARRQGADRPVFGRLTPARDRTRSFRHRRSDRRPDCRPSRHVSRHRCARRHARYRGVDPPSIVRRPIRPGPAIHSLQRLPPRRRERSRERDHGGHRRSAFLDTGRELVVPANGVARGEHDRLSRGRAGRRSRPTVCHHRARHRLRRRGRRARARSRWKPFSPRCRRISMRCATSCASPSPTCPITSRTVIITSHAPARHHHEPNLTITSHASALHR